MATSDEKPKVSCLECGDAYVKPEGIDDGYCSMECRTDVEEFDDDIDEMDDDEDDFDDEEDED